MGDAVIEVGDAERAALVLFLRSIVGGRAEAEDLAQEALLRAYVGRASFRAERSLFAWLRAIAANVAVDFLRRRGRVRFFPLEAARAEPVAPDAAADGERTAREARLLAALRVEMAELPERERRAFCLFYEDGQSIAAIARALAAPPGTVKCWLHRARERLRERLAGGEEAP